MSSSANAAPPPENTSNMDALQTQFHELAQEETEMPPAAAAAPKGGLAFCSCLREKPLPPFRTVNINEPVMEEFGDNIITTSKYTVLSFIPISLFEQ